MSHQDVRPRKITTQKDKHGRNRPTPYLIVGCLTPWLSDGPNYSVTPAPQLCAIDTQT